MGGYTTPTPLRACRAILAEKHDESAVTRRYMSADSLAKTAPRSVGGEVHTSADEVTHAKLAAVRWPTTQSVR